MQNTSEPHTEFFAWFPKVYHTRHKCERKNAHNFPGAFLAIADKSGCEYAAGAPIASCCEAPIDDGFHCTFPARMRQGQTTRAEPGVSARKNGAPHSYLFLKYDTFRLVFARKT
jgi:hypothetical protein